MFEKLFGLPKNIFFLGLTSFFNDFSNEMVLAIFPAFFTSVLKTGAASLGLVEGIADGASNIFKIYSGHLSDKLQKRKVLVVMGYTLSVLMRPLYTLTSVVLGVLGLRLVDRVGKGLREAPRDAIISFSTPKEQMGASFGFHRAMDSLGGILGPLAAYFLLEWFPLNFNLVFIVSFVIGLGAIVSLAFIHDVVVSSVHRFSISGDWYKNLPMEFTLYLAAVFLLSVGSLPIAVILLKTESIGLTIASIPLFYMIYNISYSGFSYFAGRISDQVGPRRVLTVGYCILLSSYAVLAFTSNVAGLLLGFLILGLFPALTDGVQRALASDLSPEMVRGGALGLLNAAIGIGAIFAGIGGGYVWQTFGPEAAFVASACVVIVGIIVFLFSGRAARVG
jgi:MFS family permease